MLAFAARAIRLAAVAGERFVGFDEAAGMEYVGAPEADMGRDFAAAQIH
jgi:hypothetical protein